MATNRIHENGEEIFLTVGSGVSSGDHVLVGEIPGVALTDADSNNKATVQTNGVFELDVTANDTADSGSAINEGDVLYYQNGDGTLAAGELSPDTTNGTRFGYAMEDVASGNDATIKVKIGY